MTNSCVKSIALATVLACSAAVPANEPTVTSAAYRYQWHVVEPAALKSHFRKLIRITDSDHNVHTGMLTDVFAGVVRLLRSRDDGAGVIQLRVQRIRKLEVFERLATNQAELAVGTDLEESP